MLLKVTFKEDTEWKDDQAYEEEEKAYHEEAIIENHDYTWKILKTNQK